MLMIVDFPGALVNPETIDQCMTEIGRIARRNGIEEPMRYRLVLDTLEGMDMKLAGRE